MADLADVNENESAMWERIPATVMGKSPDEVMRQYKLLVEDVDSIEAGRRRGALAGPRKRAPMAPGRRGGVGGSFRPWTGRKVWASSTPLSPLSFQQGHSVGAGFDELQWNNLELEKFKDKIKENREKIKLNKQLTYLVGNIVEIVHGSWEEGLKASIG